MKWHIACIGCCVLASTAYGQDYAPRSSSPTGIRPDVAAVSANFPLQGSQSTQGPSGGSSASQGYTSTQSSQAIQSSQNTGGNVAIQGNTSVNASARSMGSQAIGADNTSCASLGSIGECAQR